MRKRIAMVALAAWNCGAWAQEHIPVKMESLVKRSIVVRGVVKAKGRNEALTSATIYDLSRKENAVSTKKDGSFEIQLPADSKGIGVRALGYEPFQVEISWTVSADNRDSAATFKFSDADVQNLLKSSETREQLVLEGTIPLEPSVDVLATGLIRARKKVEVSQQTLRREEFERLPGGGGDPIRSLTALPGVLGNGMSSNITIRGSDSGESNYFFDRIEMPWIFHFGGMNTVIPSRMLESLDLYTGGFSSIYHNSTGGIIQLRSDNSIPERTSGQFELGLLQSGLYLEGALGNSSALQEKDERIGYRLGVRRTYLEIFKPVIKKFVEKDGGVSMVAVPSATDAQLILNGNHRLGTWQAYALAIADGVSLVAPLPFSSEEDGRGQFRMFNRSYILGLRSNMNLGNGWGLTIAPAYNYVINDQEFFSNVVFATASNFSLDTTLDKRFSKEFSATIGVRPEYERLRTDVDAVSMPTGSTTFYDFDTAEKRSQHLTENYTRYATYLDTVWKPMDGIVINPGVLYQKGERKNLHEIDPRVSARYAFLSDWTVKGGWGWYSKRPNAVYIAKDYGNPDLKMERAIHYVAGVEHKIDENWMSDVQFWYKDMRNLVGAALQNRAKLFENSGKGRAKGLEIFVKKDRSARWTGWVTYNLAQAERWDPLKEEWRAFDQDVRHSLTTVGSWRVTGRWEVSGRLAYQTGRPYTLIHGGEFNQNTGRYGAKQGLEKTGRRESTITLNTRTDYDVLFDAWKITYFADVQWNIKSSMGTRRSPDFSEERSVTPIPVIPNLGLSASF